MITSSWKVHYQTFVEAYVTGILCTIVSIITLDVYDPSIHIIKKNHYVFHFMNFLLIGLER